MFRLQTMPRSSFMVTVSLEKKKNGRGNIKRILNENSG